MYKSIIDDLKKKAEKTIEHFQHDIASLRTGRASSAIVEDIKVDYFGQKTPLSQIASISVQPPTTIVIKPWDKSALGAIGTAISNSQLGLAPVAESDFIRISVPALTQERRDQLVKLLNQKTEDAKVALRQERESSIKEIGKLDLGEDDKFKSKEDIQKVVDECNEKIKSIKDSKEKDILTN